MSATHTTNLGLNKPNRQDYVSVVTDINDNMDILDSKIGAVPSGETVEGQIGAKVPTTRKINNKALSSDVTIMGSDIPMNSLDNTKLDVAVGDLKSAIDSFVSDIDIVNATSHFYIKANGSKSDSSSWNAVVINNPVGIAKVRAVLGTNNAEYLGIAFYSDSYISADNLISGVATETSGNIISANVPENTITIAICTRNASYANPTAQIVYDVNDEHESIIPIDDWEYGSINEKGFVQVIYTLRTRSLYHFRKGDRMVFTAPSGVDLRWNIVPYTADGLVNNENWTYKTPIGYVFANDTYGRFIMRVNGVDSQINKAYASSLKVYSKYPQEEMRINPSQVGQNAIYSYSKVGMPAEWEGSYDIGGLSLACDCCFVGDELWVFSASTDDDPTSLVSYYRYTFDSTNDSWTRVAQGKHNLGHVNSIEYNKYNDCLICGNGSGDYTLQNKVFIVPNASSLQDQDNIDTRTNCIVIDCSSYNLGRKLNVVWGGANYGRNDICIFITDDNATIRRVQLGKGENDLGSGTIISGAASDEFNGTFKVLSTYHQNDCGYETCVQGATYRNGILYSGIGHNTKGSLVWAMELCEDGTVRRTGYKEVYSDASGDLWGSVAGLTTHDGYLYLEESSRLQKFKF